MLSGDVPILAASFSTWRVQRAYRHSTISNTPTCTTLRVARPPISKLNIFELRFRVLWPGKVLDPAHRSLTHDAPSCGHSPVQVQPAYFVAALLLMTLCPPNIQKLGLAHFRQNFAPTVSATLAEAATMPVLVHASHECVGHGAGHSLNTG